MFEVLIILSIFYVIKMMPLRGKTFEELSDSQKSWVEKYYAQHMRSRKGAKNPYLTIEQFMPVIHKQAITFLILAICLIPVYIAIVFWIYPMILQF